jgi:hypothetical protein
MAQAVSRRPLTSEARFCARISPCGINPCNAKAQNIVIQLEMSEEYVTNKTEINSPTKL